MIKKVFEPEGAIADFDEAIRLDPELIEARIGHAIKLNPACADDIRRVCIKAAEKMEASSDFDGAEICRSEAEKFEEESER